MNTTLRRDADEIICSSIQAVLPDKAVCRALEDFQPGGGRVLLVAQARPLGRWHTPPCRHWGAWTAAWW